MNIRNVDLNLLLVFDALATHRSVTKAARQLNLSQPALSHALNRLRETLEDDLFVRGPKGMFPTEKALSLQDGIHKILQSIEKELFEENEFLANSSNRLFRLCCTENESLSYINNFICDLQKQAPKIRFQFLNPQISDFLENMESGKTDLSFAVNLPKVSNYNYETLYSESYVCLVRKQCKTIGNRLTLKKYLAHDHILVSPLGDGKGPVDDVLAKLGHKRNISIIAPNFALIPFYLTKRDMIFTAPSLLAKELAEQFDLKVLKPPINVPNFEIQMVWHKRTDNSAPHEWLRGRIKEYVIKQMDK